MLTFTPRLSTMPAASDGMYDYSANDFILSFKMMIPFYPVL